MRFSLLFLMCASAVVSPAQPAGRDQRPEPPPPALTLVVLQGQGAIHNISSGTVTEPVVEVRDERGKPVPGAEVLFELPTKGAGGAFPDGRNALLVKSNSQGQAGGLGFTPNRVEGDFVVAVTAHQGDRSGKTLIRQSNSLRTSSTGVRPRRQRSGTWKVLLAVGGAAAAGGIFALTRGGDSSSPGAGPLPNVLTVTPGPVTVSPPR